MIFNNITESEITRILLSLFHNSEDYNKILTAQKYFTINNPPILDKRRQYRLRDGKMIDNPSAYNARITSAFGRQLITQKADYALSKKPNIIIKNHKNITPANITTDKTDDQYQLLWQIFFDKQLSKISYNMASHAINEGISFAYIYIDENADFQMQIIPADLIIPAWTDIDKNTLQYLIYEYYQSIYESTNPRTYHIAQFFDAEQIRTFDITAGYQDITKTDDKGQLENAQLYMQDKPFSWHKIPFVFLRAQPDGIPLLYNVKSYIDAYDMLISRAVDSLADDSDPLLVIKGVSADVTTLQEARELSRMTRMMSLDADGDANYLYTKSDIQGNLDMCTALRHDIMRFGHGIDYDSDTFKNSPNQMTIMSIYSNLDTYIDGLEQQYNFFIKQLKYFYDIYLDITNQMPLTTSSQYDVEIKFDRNRLVNEAERIDNAVKLSQTGISLRTQLEYNPAVEDVDIELERIKAEQAEADKKAQADIDFFYKKEDNDDTKKNN